MRSQIVKKRSLKFATSEGEQYSRWDGEKEESIPELGKNLCWAAELKGRGGDEVDR